MDEFVEIFIFTINEKEHLNTYKYDRNVEHTYKKSYKKFKLIQ